MNDRVLQITVMRGGPSAEREVSLRSGGAVAGALRSLGHAVAELDPVPGQWVLPSGVDVVFLALHGTYGEDGSVQSELERLRVPFTGCDAASSRVAFDKVLTKRSCLQAGVPTPTFLEIRNRKAAWPDGWVPPLVVKPVCQGSSVGLAFVDRPEDWPAALAAALSHDERAMVEQRIRGRELTVGLLDGMALPVVEVRPLGGAYDYRSKYTAGATEYVCPARLDPAVADRVQAVAQGAFRAVGGRDYARVDVMLDEAGRPWVLEVNTLPGMTETSLLPKAAAAAGLGFAALCQRMVEMALRRAGESPGGGARVV
jgi:D-alanine-D-alanine ligase